MFCSDKPIDSRKKDILNRTNFSKQLAEAILSYTSNDNFTISICGKWGSGKTSILNMIVEYIDEITARYEENTKPIIVRFNPWNYSDRTQLTVQFFKTILSSINSVPHNSALKKIGEALQSYSSIIEYAELIPGAKKYVKPLKGLVSGAGKNLLSISKDKNNIEQQKKTVIDALISQSQKLIVIIDDIDRLNNEQIKLIFQLVNSLAGFPNMIYLLSFDRQVVSRALSDEQNCNGEEYLEKIIQVPFDIPEAQKSLVNNLFFGSLEKLLFQEIPCDNFDKEHWDNVFGQCISPFIRGIRDVNRIMNVYRFKYGLLHNETNCIDLLALTTFQICAPEIFDWIYTNKDRLCGCVSSMGTTGNEQNATQERLLKEFAGVYKSNPEMMLNAIQSLFPKIAFDSGGYYYQSLSYDELRRQQRIACPSRFSLYFHLSLEDVLISKNQIIESINYYDQNMLYDFFEKLMEQEHLYAYLQELNSYITDIPKARLRMFIDKLIEMQTIDKNYERKDQFTPAPAYECNQCCWKILKNLDEGQVAIELKSIVEMSTFESFPVILGMILMIERSFGRIGPSLDKTYRVVDESSLDTLEKCVKNKINELSKENNLLDMRDLFNLYYVWNYIDSNSMNSYFSEALKSAFNIPKYLNLKFGYWHSSDEYGWTFREEDITEYFELNTIYNKVNSLKGTNEFISLKQKEKEIAIAFYLWYNSKDKECRDISKSTVDALMPEWECSSN